MGWVSGWIGFEFRVKGSGFGHQPKSVTVPNPKPVLNFKTRY